MTTIYFEAGLPATLVPVQFIAWAKTPAHDVTGCFNVVVKLKRDASGYSRGEVLHVPTWSVVEKASRRDYRHLVRNAALPLRTEANTIGARV